MDELIANSAVVALAFAAGALLLAVWKRDALYPRTKEPRPITKIIAGYELVIRLMEDGVAVFPSPEPLRVDDGGRLFFAKGFTHVAVYRQPLAPIFARTDVVARLGPETWLVCAAEQLPRDGHPVHHWTAESFR